jgi:hypothetical protein
LYSFRLYHHSNLHPCCNKLFSNCIVQVTIPFCPVQRGVPRDKAGKVNSVVAEFEVCMPTQLRHTNSTSRKHKSTSRSNKIGTLRMEDLKTLIRNTKVKTEPTELKQESSEADEPKFRTWRSKRRVNSVETFDEPTVIKKQRMSDPLASSAIPRPSNSWVPGNTPLGRTPFEESTERRGRSSNPAPRRDGLESERQWEEDAEAISDEEFTTRQPLERAWEITDMESERGFDDEEIYASEQGLEFNGRFPLEEPSKKQGLIRPRKVVQAQRPARSHSQSSSPEPPAKQGRGWRKTPAQGSIRRSPPKSTGSKLTRAIPDSTKQAEWRCYTRSMAVLGVSHWEAIPPEMDVISEEAGLGDYWPPNFYRSFQTLLACPAYKDNVPYFQYALRRAIQVRTYAKRDKKKEKAQVLDSMRVSRGDIRKALKSWVRDQRDDLPKHRRDLYRGMDKTIDNVIEERFDKGRRPEDFGMFDFFVSRYAETAQRAAALCLTDTDLKMLIEAYEKYSQKMGHAFKLAELSKKLPDLRAHRGPASARDDSNKFDGFQRIRDEYIAANPHRFLHVAAPRASACSPPSEVSWVSIPTDDKSEPSPKASFRTRTPQPLHRDSDDQDIIFVRSRPAQQTTSSTAKSKQAPHHPAKSDAASM